MLDAGTLTIAPRDTFHEDSAPMLTFPDWLYGPTAEVRKVVRRQAIRGGSLR